MFTIDTEVMRTTALLFHNTRHDYSDLKERSRNTQVFQETTYIFSYITYIHMPIYKSPEISALV